MINERDKELRLKCLEFATENSKHCPTDVLKLAEQYWRFVTTVEFELPSLKKDLDEIKN